MSTALQNALAAIDLAIGPYADESKQLIRAKCRGLVAGYDHAFADAGFVAERVEHVYQSPLFNPDTGKASRTFTTAGKVDVLAERDGRTYIIDHKALSEDFSDPNAPLWSQLAIEGQVSQYLYLMHLEGRKPDHAIWDVMHKPSIAPKKLSKLDRGAVVADRKYFGRTMSEATLLSLQINEREPMEMYEARLAHDCIEVRPEWYFQRRAVPRLDADILEYGRDLWEQGQLILASRKRERLPKHSGACFAYHRPCQFLGICSGRDTPDSDRWKIRDDKHPELEGRAKGDVLTNSRVKVFQLCPTRHLYQYEMGLERYEEEEVESLYFGSCWHTALEAWWRTFMRKGNDDHVNGTTAAATAASSG